MHSHYQMKASRASYYHVSQFMSTKQGDLDKSRKSGRQTQLRRNPCKCQGGYAASSAPLQCSCAAVQPCSLAAVRPCTPAVHPSRAASLAHSKQRNHHAAQHRFRTAAARNHCCTAKQSGLCGAISSQGSTGRARLKSRRWRNFTCMLHRHCN